MYKTLFTKISDLLSNKSVASYYKTYSKTQFYTTEEMSSYQLQKLIQLVTHCYENVSYYRSFMIENNIHPNDINDLSQIKLFPIITKNTILENYESFIPNNIKKLTSVKTSQTGGTTGRILSKRTDSSTRSSVWASYRRFYDWMGVTESDLKLKIMGGHINKTHFKDKIKTQVNNMLFNEFSFDPYDTSDLNTEKIRVVLKNKNIKLIRSYSQYLYTLARNFEAKKETFNVKAIMTTAEPLMPEHRQLFKKVFNAESFDQYGCGEIGAIAFECSAHEGLHITDERVIIEVDDQNNLIITDLDNFAMPYIRYKNDDQAILSDTKCSCGRQSKLIKKIMGRSCDYIIGSNGKSLHWAYFWHLMFDTEIAYNRNVKKFQIRQTDEKTILFRTVGEELSENDQKIIRDSMFEKLGEMDIQFINENDIENSPSGKYRPVVNLLLTNN